MLCVSEYGSIETILTYFLLRPQSGPLDFRAYQRELLAVEREVIVSSLRHPSLDCGLRC